MRLPVEHAQVQRQQHEHEHREAGVEPPVLGEREEGDAGSVHQTPTASGVSTSTSRGVAIQERVAEVPASSVPG